MRADVLGDLERVLLGGSRVQGVPTNWLGNALVDGDVCHARSFSLDSDFALLTGNKAIVAAGSHAGQFDLLSAFGIRTDNLKASRVVWTPQGTQILASDFIIVMLGG